MLMMMRTVFPHPLHSFELHLKAWPPDPPPPPNPLRPPWHSIVVVSIVALLLLLGSHPHSTTQDSHTPCAACTHVQHSTPPLQKISETSIVHHQPNPTPQPPSKNPIMLHASQPPSQSPPPSPFTPPCPSHFYFFANFHFFFAGWDGLQRTIFMTEDSISNVHLECDAQRLFSNGMEVEPYPQRFVLFFAENLTPHCFSAQTLPKVLRSTSFSTYTELPRHFYVRGIP